MPHVYCLRLPEVIWLYVVANAAIAVAYFSIPITLVFFIRRRKDIAFSWMFLLFGLFILACGTTHVLDVITLWHPIYRFDVVVRLITAVASIATAILLVTIMPQALLLPNPTQLQVEIAKRSQAQGELESLNQLLEQRVLERTAGLNASNAELELAVKELRYQLELNRAITTQAGDSILCTDKSGRISFLNPQAERTFGYHPAELIGRHLHDALHLSPAVAEQIPAEDCTLVKATENGTLLNDWSTEFFRKDGTSVQVACSLGPVEVNGQRSGSVIIVRDVTERVHAERALRQSEQQYRTLVEAMPHLVWSATADGQVDFFSTQWLEYTGSQASGSPWQESVHPHDWPSTQQAWSVALKTLREYEVEHRLRRRDGVWKWFKTRAVVLLSEEGKALRWLGTATDIDADKRAKVLLEQFNSDLQNLASAMAHDLHEPLRSISVQTQMLARFVHKDLNDKGAEIVAGVVESAVHMRRLLQDITVYSEAITRPLDIRPVLLLDLVESVVARRKERLDWSGTSVRIEIDPALLVEADHESMRLVFYQLLENALAYRRAQSGLDIRIAAENQGSEVMVTFSDNGVGIKPEYYERVFQLFKRLHKQHEHPGSGIGLAMCQKILQRHGKNIWVRSSAEGGAAFFFPLQSPTAADQEEGLLNAPAAGRG